MVGRRVVSGGLYSVCDVLVRAHGCYGDSSESCWLYDLTR